MTRQMAAWIVTGSIQTDGWHGFLVLNAFRHRRDRHAAPGDYCYWLWKCSTPSGIEGIVTGTVREVYDFGIRCSTPSGIEGIVTAEGRYGPINRLECSTPSGIEGIVTLQANLPATYQV